MGKRREQAKRGSEAEVATEGGSDNGEKSPTPPLNVHRRCPKPIGETTPTTPQGDTKNEPHCPLPGTDPERDHSDPIRAGERNVRNPLANRHQLQHRTHLSR